MGFETAAYIAMIGSAGYSAYSASQQESPEAPVLSPPAAGETESQTKPKPKKKYRPGQKLNILAANQLGSGGGGGNILGA